MTMMKAVRIHQYGGPDILTYEDASRPAPQRGEILIRIHATGVNPVDWKVRRGDMQAYWPLSFPAILGSDVAGVVEAVGDGAAEYAIGDRVFGSVRSGGYAEYVACPADHAAPIPVSLDFTQAGALPVAGLTAWQALFDHGGVTAGQRVLIHAAAGGVGHLAVQFARIKGAEVYATASGRNAEFVRSLGADTVIDYTSERFETRARDMDMVLDTMGGETQARSWGVLKPGGVLVSIVSPQTPQAGEAQGHRGVFFGMESNGAQLAEIGRLLAAGQTRVDVGLTLPLAEAARAHQESEGGHTRGKIVLTVA